MRAIGIAALLALALPQMAARAQTTPPPKSDVRKATGGHPPAWMLPDNAPAAAAPSPGWYALVLAGSDEHPVFDRFVTDFSARLRQAKVDTTAYLAQGAPTRDKEGEVNPVHLRDAAPGGNKACLLYVTSHGSQDGFVHYAKDPRGLGVLTAGDLAVLADQTCGNRPAAIVVSACFGAAMVTPTLLKPNRVVLTAARRDRSSFGCSFTETYNYFDGCILKHWEESSTWGDLFRRAKACISEREGPRKDASEPQIFVGDAAKTLAVPH